MKTNVQETSCDAYHSDKMRTNDLAGQIMVYAYDNKRFTCKMAAQFIGVDASTLAGVIKNKLMPAGSLKRELSKNPCYVTGNMAHWLYAEKNEVIMLKFNKKEDRPMWVSDDEKYMVEQVPQGKNEPVYFCYTKNSVGGQTWRFMSSRETPETAMEYCSIMAGFK